MNCSKRRAFAKPITDKGRISASPTASAQLLVH